MNRIQKILYILNYFLPYEICLKIIYKYGGFKTPSCKYIKPFIKDCHKFIYREKRNKMSLFYKVYNYEILYICPNISKIIQVRKNKNPLHFSTDKKNYNITCSLKYSYIKNNIEVIIDRWEITIFFNL